MKKLLYLFIALLLMSCTQERGYVLEGEYPAANEGTVVYLSKYMVFDLDEMLVPVDSAVVKNGKFSFEGTSDGFDVCFISSSKIVDGGFVVLENGNITYSFNGEGCGGTLWNKELNRFMREREKLLSIKEMSSPAMQNKMLLEPAMLDSINELAVYASKIFDSYALGLIRKNAGNKLGHFFLTQSAGVVAPGKLLSLFPLVPNEYRDRLYEGKKMQVEAEMKENLELAKYAIEAQEVAKETSVGKKYQNFELNDIAGKKILFSDKVSSSKYTLLLFWATWNKNSVEFAKELDKHCSQYGPKEINIVTVSLDDEISKCSMTVDFLGLSGTHLCNPAKGSAELASAYGICDLPLCLLINRNGVIIARTSSAGDIEKKLKEILP